MEIFIIKKEDQMEKLLNLLGSSYFPGLTNSIKISANMVKRKWIESVKKAKTKEGWKIKYINSININFENELNVEVYADENNKFVNFVETGIKRFDMKDPPKGKGLLNGPNSRQGKNGRYNIVFFQKGVPGTQHIQTMGDDEPSSQAIYKKINQLSKSDIVKRYKTIGISKKIQMKSKTVKKRIKTKTSKGPGGLQKIGSPRHTQYGTFRVVTKDSPGWIYPGVPEAKVFSLVARTMKSKVKQIMKEGLILDIKSLESLRK